MADDSQVIASAIVELSVKTDGLAEGMRTAHDETQKAVDGMQRSVEGLSFKALSEQAEKFSETINEKFGEAYGAFTHLEDAQTRLSGIMQATGDAAHMGAKGMAELTEKITENTVYTKASTTQAEALLSRFTEINDPEIFKGAITAAADLAAVTGGDLTDSVQKLGIALTDPENAFGRLKRAGITFTEAQKEQIKTMQDSGDMAGAQALMLRALEGRVGGLAEKMAAINSGEMAMFKKGIEEIYETVGKTIAEAIGPFITKFAELAKSVAQYMAGHPALVAGLVGAAAAITAFSTATAIAAAAMAAFAIAGSPVILTLAAIATAIGLAVAAYTALTGKTQENALNTNQAGQAWMDAQKRLENAKQMLDRTTDGTTAHSEALKVYTAAQANASTALEAYHASMKKTPAETETVAAAVDKATKAVKANHDELAKTPAVEQIAAAASISAAQTTAEAKTDAVITYVEAAKTETSDLTDEIVASDQIILQSAEETTVQLEENVTDYAGFTNAELLRIEGYHKSTGEEIVKARKELNQRIKDGDVDTMTAFEAGLAEGSTAAKSWAERVYDTAKSMGNNVDATMKSVFEDLFSGHMKTAAEYASKLKDAMLKSFADMLAGWISAQVTQTILDGMSALWKSLSDTAAAAADGAAAGTAYATSYNAAVEAGMAGGAAGGGVTLASTASTTGLTSGAVLGAGAMAASTALSNYGYHAAGGGAAGIGASILLTGGIGTIGSLLTGGFNGPPSISDAAHAAAVDLANKTIRDSVAAKLDAGQTQAALINAGLAWYKAYPQWGNIDAYFADAANNGLAAAFPGLNFGISDWTKVGNGLAPVPPSIIPAAAWQTLMANPMVAPFAAGLPHLATGGIVSQPTVALIGEKGPEAVVPLSGPNAPVGGQPMIVKLMINTRELASVLLDMSRTGALKLDTNALITVGSI